MSEENVSLPVAQALASALAKIEAYVPTEYVDNSEPDLDAEHLNHAEQGIMRVTNLLNAAVDVIQGQESRLVDAENKIGTAALTGGMTDLSSGLNKLNSDLQYLKKAESNTQLIESSVDSYTDIQSLNISPGVYIVIGRIEFQSTSATGDRKGRLAFSTSSSTLELATECVRAASNNWVRLNVCDILQVDTPGSIKVQGSQNSGSAINTFGWVTYMRLKAL